MLIKLIIFFLSIVFANFLVTIFYCLLWSVYFIHRGRAHFADLQIIGLSDQFIFLFVISEMFLSFI